MNDTIKGSISAVLYSTLIGLSFLFSKIALVEGNTIDILAHRFTSAFIAIFLYTLITKKRKVVSKSDIIALLPLSLVSPVLYFSLQLLGLSMSSSSEGGIIQSTIPIFTMIFGIILLKEKPSLRRKFINCPAKASICATPNPIRFTHTLFRSASTEALSAQLKKQRSSMTDFAVQRFPFELISRENGLGLEI